MSSAHLVRWAVYDVNIHEFSLKNHGVHDEVDEMFDMGVETMALPLDEKLKFEQGNDGMSFGFVFDIKSPLKININYSR